ncbi:hypothetical protein AALO_G00108810 [Alosa alosa]|uniref:Ig-like domain-containing protein n=2 Tax=Alosa alosa TaxID=278164 RepID=A0AAV6GND2_9TELE|nr:hypothetical protein AALO_G00108810 [Alosa alosa]
MLVLEGQTASLRCEAVGDPTPTIHWIAPDERLLGNSSRTVLYANGTLDITITTSKDYGTFTCIAANVAGESTATVELSIIQLPHISNGTGPAVQPKSRLSDITGTTRTSKGATGSSPKAKAAVHLDGLSPVRWSVSKATPKVKMYQLQYNCSDDEVLIYRMIPASSKAFHVTNLVSGTKYDLCVLAAWDDTATTLTATNVVGCVQFFTRDDYPQCQSLHSQLLGGTMILVVGGVIVATLLVFIVILMVRYKVGDNGEPPASKLTNVSDTYSQTNGGRLGQNGMPMPPLRPSSSVSVGSAGSAMAKPKVTMRDEVVEFKCGSLQSSLTSSDSSDSDSLDGDGGGGRRGAGGGRDGSYSPNSALASIWRSATPKPRTNLDQLLGAFNSLDLRSQAGGPSGGSESGLGRGLSGVGGAGRAGGPSTSSSSAAAPPTDKEPLLGRTLDSRLSRLLMLPLDARPKRSHSFDMGDFAASTGQQLCSYPRRISSIWTKRSLSVNGMLLQCDEELDTGGSKGTIDSGSDWVMESTV